MKISIVTVCRNSATTIKDTLRSVAAQGYSGVEHIIVDGVSKDATLDVVRDDGRHVARLVSEPDRGIYDAMNKGVRLSTGEVIGFLNADDWYASPDILHLVVEAFAAGADLTYGDLVYVSPEAPFAVRRIWRDAVHCPADFFRRGWQPAHPTTFVRRELFETCGGFDLRWKIGADYAFLARAMKQPGLRLRYLPRTLVNMRVGGASTSGIRAVWQANLECLRALRECGASWPLTTISMKTARKVPQLLVPRDVYSDRALWRPWAG